MPMKWDGVLAFEKEQTKKHQSMQVKHREGMITTKER